MVDNIIKSVAEKLSSLSYIEGIVLGGSRARGTHTEDSDIDIGIYYNSESFDINTINQFATKLDDEHRNNLVVPPGAWGDWINGGGWLVINGYHVDLILRDIKRVEQIMKDTEHGIVTANYQTGHPHGYISAMYRGELAISKILYAKNESLCELKKQAETYPNALQKSLVNFFMFEAGFSLMFVKANSGTDDKYYIAGHVFRIVSCLNQVLFACNNAYCINEKKAIKLLETFEHKPEKYTEKVNHIFEVLGISLFECYDMTDKDCRIKRDIVPTDIDYHVRKPSAREYDDCCNEFWNVTPYVIKGLCRKEILFAIDHFNQIVRHELLRMISWKVGIETGFKLSVGKNYKFIERYISEDLWEKLLSTYRMDSYENIWEALFLCHQLFRAVSGEVAERLHYAYPEYDRNITKYTRDMYKKYTGKTGCLDSTYAADIEERREQ